MRLSRRGKRGAGPELGGDQGGAAYAEFLIAFPAMLTIFLVLIQLGLIHAARLAVAHASVRAARAAVVVLPDDPRYYGGERINRLSHSESGSNVAAASFDLLGFAGGMPGGRGSTRLRAIRSAAMVPLIPFSPDWGSFADEEALAQAFPSVGTVASGGLVYTQAAVAVSFPREPESMFFQSEFGRREDVTTRVTYLYHCGIPIVGRWMCDTPFSIFGVDPDPFLMRVTGGSPPRGDFFTGLMDRVEGSLELFRFVENRTLTAVALASGDRFLLLRSEATMPNQGAEYDYARR